MDYKLLLLKYIAHVGYEEGVTFISRLHVGEVFSEEEIFALNQLENLDRCGELSEKLMAEEGARNDKANRAHEENRLALLKAKTSALANPQ